MSNYAKIFRRDKHSSLFCQHVNYDENEYHHITAYDFRLLSSSLTMRQNKLECLSLEGQFSPLIYIIGQEHNIQGYSLNSHLLE
jgi:hypothetical protein